MTDNMISYKELFDQMHRFLRKCGYQLDPSIIAKMGNREIDKCLEILNLYYDKREHRIEPKIRAIHRSSIINEKIRTSAISQDEIDALNAIEENAKNGQDTWLHQNKNVAKLATNWEKQDKLFNDWNIAHFHLGTTQEPDYPRFYRRTRNVLMAFPTKDALLFLDVVPHGDNDPEPWYTKGLVEILHQDFPSFIEPFRAPRASNVQPKTTEDTVKSFRGETQFQRDAAIANKKQGNDQRYITSMTYALETDDGTVYLPFGGGLSTIGMRMMTTRRSLHVMRQLSDASTKLAENKQQVCDYIQRTCGTRLNDLKIGVNISSKNLWDAKLEIKEARTNQVLLEFRF